MAFARFYYRKQSGRCIGAVDRLRLKIVFSSNHCSQWPIGTSLERATKAYNSSVGSLERTVLPPLRRIHELGVKSKDEFQPSKPIDTSIRELSTMGVATPPLDSE